MTPRGGPLLDEPGGDNTPQGKLTRGCGVVLLWLVLAVLGIIAAQWAEHAVCDGHPDRFLCPPVKR